VEPTKAEIDVIRSKAGTIITQILKSEGMTQRFLAKALHVDQHTITSIKRRNRCSGLVATNLLEFCAKKGYKIIPKVEGEEP
jgi:predicted XRE-type DNA-binding protein